MQAATRLAVVAYAYYPRHRAHLLGLIERLTRGVEDARVVWVHAPGQSAAAPTGFAGRWAERAHDGRGWEWGAYQAGFEALQAQGWTGSVCFINDTAGIHFPLPARALAALKDAALAHADAPVLAGHVHTAAPGFALHGQPFNAYVFSNAFVLTARACAALDQRLFSAADFDGPAVRADGTLAWPRSVSAALAAHLDAWLLSPGKHGWRHHARRASVPPQQLRDKAGAILLEKRLSARVLAAGGRLLHCGPNAQGPWQRLKLRAFYWRRRFAPMKAAA